MKCHRTNEHANMTLHYKIIYFKRSVLQVNILGERGFNVVKYTVKPPD